MRIHIGPRRKNRPLDLVERRKKENFQRTVLARAKGRSQLSGERTERLDAHHVIKRQTLRRIAPELEWDADLGMLLTRDEHEGHENRSQVIPFEKLPDYVFRCISDDDLLLYHLEKNHPPRGL